MAKKTPAVVPLNTRYQGKENLQFTYFLRRQKLLSQLRSLNAWAKQDGWGKEKLIQQSLVVQRQFHLLAWDAAAKRYGMVRRRTGQKRVVRAKEFTADKYSNKATYEAIAAKFESIEEMRAMRRLSTVAQAQVMVPGRIVPGGA